MRLFDVHAHLTSPKFQGEVPAVLERAKEAGVTKIISNGLNRKDNEKVLALARESSLVRPALGLYPVDAVLPEMTEAGVDYPREDTQIEPAEAVVAWIAENASDAIAIGEIGLDHHWVPEQFWARQEQVFRSLVQVALELDKPIIIHTRKAEARCFEILVELGVKRVNWHCYSSRLKLARQIADYGHFLSIPSNVRRSETFTGMLRTLPRSQLLLETDCPYLAPVPGERSEPMHVRGTATFASELWGVPLEEAARTFEENFERLFREAP
ncbi:MAG: hypothetical protein B6A08_02175 [Sorangiineae bacterium NIC37A_2]|jgi:TatD DNase family protein|nr:MAG: hypothetical protein B6A08_02175 [Sorangiineae bacterium NIC37A_2]